MITFDRQAGPLQNFNRSHVMVIGRSVSFSDPARPPGGGVGRPKHPKIPPSEKKLVGKKTYTFFASPPPPKKNISVTKNFHPPPPPTHPRPTPTPPPSPQNTHLNPGAITSTPNNSCVRYGLQPPTHLINTYSQQCLCTACLSMFTL